MKKSLAIIFLLTNTFISLGQDKLDKKTSAIIDEGKLLYKSEMASWYGTDIFIDKFKDRRDNIGGYFSYSDNSLAKCIFFSKGDNPKVIGTISFDSTYNANQAQVDGGEREFTTNENDIYTIRKKALAEIKIDTIFKTYKNTSLNLIPLIANGEKKVFVLTGPKVSGVVILGNDYLLTFDNQNNLKNKKQLHRNILTIEYNENTKQKDELVSMHSHLSETGDLITSTDVCTIMLYEKFAKWKQHIVISEKYVCLWDCTTDQLVTMTKVAWDKIYKDQKKRHPEK